MTDKPQPCHYDRGLRMRVTRRHADTCTRDDRCPGHDGCQPCDQRHCVVCGREHTTTATPQTCPECQRKVDDDLVDIQTSYALLAREAVAAGGDGQLVAAAPIPGGDAQVLIGPTVRLDMLRTSRTMSVDHRRGDPLPPLAVLAQWEDMYRAWLDHDRGQRASISRAIGYLRDQLPYIAQKTGGPDWFAFTRQVRKLRSQLEHARHDEQEPERGVECFECGDRLVRRIRSPRLCRHSTPARRWVRTLTSYGLAVYASEIQAARLPCEACQKAGQGGVDDPRPGRSWECPGCRREYGANEYSHAVRRSLLEEGDGTGWCSLQAAADAAADISMRPVSPQMIRVWIARKADIRVCCAWSPGVRSGVQLVYWPDVLTRATEPRTQRRRSVS